MPSREEANSEPLKMFFAASSAAQGTMVRSGTNNGMGEVQKKSFLSTMHPASLGSRYAA